MRKGSLQCFRAIVVTLVVVVVGCGSPEEEKTALSELFPPHSEEVEAPKMQEETSPGMLTAQVKVVDLEGKPLAGMLPIVTDHPNAFKRPVTAGAATTAQGAGEVMIPKDTWLYLRAWDPQLRYFANNYFDIVPGGSILEDTLSLTMAPAASLSTRLLDNDGTPFSEKTVGLLLLHPEIGPWWPSEGTTDANGAIHFAPLPPGKYLLRFEVETGEQCELPELLIMPGETTELPAVAFP